MEKRLLFLPTYFYMSNQFFIKIAETTQEYFTKVYIDPQDPFLYYDRYQDEEKIKLAFNETYFLQSSSFHFLNRYLKSNIFLKLLLFLIFFIKLKKYQHKFI